MFGADKTKETKEDVTPKVNISVPTLKKNTSVFDSTDDKPKEGLFTNAKKPTVPGGLFTIQEKPTEELESKESENLGKKTSLFDPVATKPIGGGGLFQPVNTS